MQEDELIQAHRKVIKAEKKLIQKVLLFQGTTQHFTQFPTCRKMSWNILSLASQERYTQMISMVQIIMEYLYSHTGLLVTWTAHMELRLTIQGR